MATQCVHIIAVNLKSARYDDIQPPDTSDLKRYFCRQWINTSTQIRNNLVVIHAMVPEDKADTYVCMLVKKFEDSLPSGPDQRLERKDSLKDMLNSPVDKSVSLYAVDIISPENIKGHMISFTKRCLMFNSVVENAIGVDPAGTWSICGHSYQDSVSNRNLLIALPINISAQRPSDTAVCPNCFEKKPLYALECKHVSCEYCILTEGMFTKGHCYACGKHSDTYQYIPPSSILVYCPNCKTCKKHDSNCCQAAGQAGQQKP